MKNKGKRIGKVWFDESWAKLKKADFVRAFNETPQAVATGKTPDEAWTILTGKKSSDK